MMETPLVYNLIMENRDIDNYLYAPKVDDIILYTSASKDPTFQKPKFLRYLEEYKKDGLCCGRPKEITKERTEYYDRLQNQKLYDLSKAIKQNIDDRENRNKRVEYLKVKYGQ